MRADRRTLLIGAGALMSGGMALGACTRATAPAAPEPVGIDLDLSALEARHGGRLGVSVLTEGKRADWRGDERFLYCSTFKMYLAAATLLRVQAGQERLDRAIPVTQADMIAHAPVTAPAVGSTLTVEQLMKGAVEVSDNPAANILIREMGGLDALRAFYRGIGDETIRVDRLEPELNRADGDKDTIQPAQSARNIERLILSEASPLESASKRLLLEWMVAVADRAGAPEGGRPFRLDRRAQDRHGRRRAGERPSASSIPSKALRSLWPSISMQRRTSTDAQREAVIADAARLTLKAQGHG
nr:serine hydrolase [Enterobacter roggenkampii]